MSITLPRAQTVMVDGQGRPTREFYQWFRAVVGGIEGQISDLSNIVQGLVNISKSLGSPEGSTTDIISVVNALSDKVDIARVVTGAWSVRGGGPLSDDVILRLDGDRQDPGISMMYATDENGARGWIPQGIPSFVTTDDVAEGAANLYFTTERAQDAVGTILSGAGDVPLAYDDAGNAISASLSATGIAAGTYGDATHVARVTFDAKGRATGVQAVAISASSGGLDSLITDSGDAFMTEDGADLLVA